MLIKEIADEVCLDSVDHLCITEVLEIHFQPPSNKELYDLAEQLTEQQKEDEDEIDPEWEGSSTVKRGIRVMLHPYYEILLVKKKKSKQLTLHSFLVSSEPRAGPPSAK